MLKKICQYLKPISISLSPNTERDDVWLALKLVFCPWSWKKSKAILQLENEFKKYLGVKYAFAFNSGRSSLMAILKSLELSSQDEVLLQAFTCNAAVNPVLWQGAKLVYIDCNEDDFNIDIEDLKRKITLRQAQGKTPKVIMVQHTFGIPADIDKVLDIARENNLTLIEDCAHALGAEVGLPAGRRGLPAEAPPAGGAKAGRFGRAAFFSFSRDKVISSIYGGMVVTNDDKLGAKLLEFRKEIKYPSYCWILQQLMHPILMNYLILPSYRILGKYLLVLFQWLRILSKAVHWKEKRGRKPSYFPKKMPNALALLALKQFKKLERFNTQRKEIADFYYENLKNSSFELPKISQNTKPVFLRFTIKYPAAHKIIKKAWQQNILIGDWYTSPVAPDDTDLTKLQYRRGSCPKAEKLSKTTLNLPTHINISKKEAQKIIDFLKKY